MASEMVLMSRCNDDRISNLPNGILCHILSFLPTKYSVRTRVLSKRWKQLFTFVPILDFEYSSVKNTCIETYFTEFNARRRTSSNKFVDFVNSVFFAYKVSKMNKFRLIQKSEFLNEHCDLVTWICIAMCRRVIELDIAVSLRRFQTLPRHVFSSDTLASLKIDGSFSILLPDSVCLPCLRTCHLFRVWLSGDSALRLFRSCPVLEDLMLIYCDMRDVQSLEISGLALERFVIHDSGRGYQLVLDAPKLLSFEYVGRARIGVSKGEFFRSLVNRICHVRSLSVSAFLVQAFQYSGNSLPKFPNLTSLTIGLTSTLGLGILLDFLDRSPRLEVLVISKESLENENNEMEEDTHLVPEHVPACVSKHIKKIEYTSFSMFEYDFKLVKYFLKNALVLDKMKIQTRINCEEKLEISTKVLAFPRCSTACEIEFESVAV